MPEDLLRLLAALSDEGVTSVSPCRTGARSPRRKRRRGQLHRGTRRPPRRPTSRNRLLLAPWRAESIASYRGSAASATRANARQRRPRLRHLNQSAILILEPDAAGGQQTGYSSAARRDTDLGRAVENESKSQGCTSRCAQDPARRLVTQGSGGEMAYEIQLNDQGLLQCRVCLA